MKRKLLTTIILGISISSMIISCGDSTKDNSKKETKKVETASISAEKSTKTAETSTITIEKEKETETAKNEENSSKENKTSEQNNTVIENNEDKKQIASNNEGTENNVSSNNNEQVNTNNNEQVSTNNNNNNNSSSSEGSNSSSSEQKAPEQTEAPKSVYKDGTYTGFGDGMNGKVKVNVTISGDKITSISVGENNEDEEYLAEAKGVIDRIISSQNTNIDVVSGATYSSNGIIGGVNEALSKAKN